LETQLEAQRLKIEKNRLNAKGATARVQTSERMEITDNQKKEEKYSKMQRLELASIWRGIKGNNINKMQISPESTGKPPRHCERPHPCSQ
jgi:hypothetical protein